MLKWVGINLYLVNRCLLIKYDHLRMLTAMSLSAFLDGLAFFPHLLSTNHKCTHPCLIAAQKRTLKWRTTTTSKSSRHAFTSQLPVGLDEALLKISYRISVERLKTFVFIYRSVIMLCTLSCLRFGHCL